MTAFALGVHVFRVTQSAAGFSLVMLSLFLPSILLKPVGGVLADRFDRRWMIIIGDAGAGLGVFVLLLVVSGAAPPLWITYLCVAAISGFSALQNPAYKASVTDLLTKEQYASAAGLVQFASSAQHLVSPAVAGLLMSVTTIRTVLVIDAATFVMAIVAVLFVTRSGQDSPGRSERRSLPQDLREGWRAVVDDRPVRGVVWIISLVTLCVGVLQTLFGPMILTTTSARTLGGIQSVSATGMVLTSLLLGLVTITRKHETTLVVALAVAGAGLSVVGTATNLAVIAVAFFLLYAAIPFINTSAEVLIRSRVANEMQGRAWGLIGFLSQVGYVIAYGTSGLVADRVFEPLFAAGGVVSPVLARLVGTGPGRGMGCMLLAAGIGLCAVAVVATLVVTPERRNGSVVSEQLSVIKGK
jgi:MFS family permease